MSKTFKILNIFLMITALLAVIYYRTHGGIVLKGITSSWFVIIGAVNLFYLIRCKISDFRFPGFMLLGLILSMVADIVLGYDFITGAIIFAAGHICYFIAYCVLISFRKQDIKPSIILFVFSALFLILAPFFDFGSVIMEGVCVFYALIISFMLGKALSNSRSNRTVLFLLLAVGSAMFFFSDLMLVLNMFSDAPKITSELCSYTYWPGQSILAHSLFHYTKSPAS